MKYIIITSKHHDGFALFDSKVSSYDIVNATPYRRDAIRALSSAARRAGLKFGVYYSIMDWHHPDAQAPAYPELQLADVQEPQLRPVRRDVHEAAAARARDTVSRRSTCSGSTASGSPTGATSRADRSTTGCADCGRA
jgi:alpha-L-fucosidase